MQQQKKQSKKQRVVISIILVMMISNLGISMRITSVAAYTVSSITVDNIYDPTDDNSFNYGDQVKLTWEIHPDPYIVYRSDIYKDGYVIASLEGSGTRTYTLTLNQMADVSFTIKVFEIAVNSPNYSGPINDDNPTIESVTIQYSDPLSGTFTDGTHEYELIETPLSWGLAEEECIKRGGHLVTINSAFENNIVKYLAAQLDKESDEDRQRVWIGLTDKGKDGTFTWVTREPLTYINWNGGEPDHSAIEYCVGLRGYDGDWFDDTSALTYPFVCEWDNVQIRDDTDNDDAYELISYKLTWKAAKEYCENRGGHLVTIKNIQENNFVQNMATQLPKESSTDRQRVWIGLTDEKKEGTFTWVTGKTSSYYNWNGGNPENGINSEDYVGLRGYDGEWFDDINGLLYPFICEWNYDSDGDDIPDYAETCIYKTDRFDPDSDDDGFSDGKEINLMGTNPNNFQDPFFYDEEGVYLVDTDPSKKYNIDVSSQPVLIRYEIITLNDETDTWISFNWEFDIQTNQYLDGSCYLRGRYNDFIDSFATSFTQFDKHIVQVIIELIPNDTYNRFQYYVWLDDYYLGLFQDRNTKYNTLNEKEWFIYVGSDNGNAKFQNILISPISRTTGGRTQYSAINLLSVVYAPRVEGVEVTYEIRKSSSFDCTIKGTLNAGISESFNIANYQIYENQVYFGTKLEYQDSNEIVYIQTDYEMTPIDFYRNGQKNKFLRGMNDMDLISSSFQKHTVEYFNDHIYPIDITYSRLNDRKYFSGFSGIEDPNGSRLCFNPQRICEKSILSWSIGYDFLGIGIQMEFSFTEEFEITSQVWSDEELNPDFYYGIPNGNSAYSGLQPYVIIP